jgi:hypothetical protein
MPPCAISDTMRYRPTMTAGDAVVRESEDIDMTVQVMDRLHC